jgi:hypothetical protein
MSDEAIQALEEAIQALEEATGKYQAPDLDCARAAFKQQVGLVAAGTPRDLPSSLVVINTCLYVYTGAVELAA